MPDIITEERSVSVKIDGITKKKAEEILDELGLDMTAYIAASVKALVREKKIPFNMVTREYLDEQEANKPPMQPMPPSPPVPPPQPYSAPPAATFVSNPPDTGRPDLLP